MSDRAGHGRNAELIFHKTAGEGSSDDLKKDLESGKPADRSRMKTETQSRIDEINKEIEDISAKVDALVAKMSEGRQSLEGQSDPDLQSLGRKIEKEMAHEIGVLKAQREKLKSHRGIFEKELADLQM